MIRVIEGDTADQMWIRAAEVFRTGDDVAVQSSRAGYAYEVLHALLAVSNPRERWILSRQPAINPAFAIAEVVWILTARNDAAFLNHWNPVLPRFAGAEATYYGAYGHRLRHNFGIDQLEQAYRTLEQSPDSRQVVLQIWDASRDLPKGSGIPRAKDIPCNVCSMLKVRRGKLEWMQVLRSNDLFLGVPYNVVQFTTIQEVIAGWLNLELGAYAHLSDSLHVYQSHLEHVRSALDEAPPPNTDALSLPKPESDRVWSELERLMEVLVSSPELSPGDWIALVSDPQLPLTCTNLFYVVAADDARRRGWTEAAEEAMSRCSNPVLSLAWQRWVQRRALSAPRFASAAE